MVSLAGGFFGPNGTRKAEDTGAANPGGDHPLGSWKDGKFSFYSPQAEAQWRNESVHSGVHFQNWTQGRKLNEKTQQLVELGFAPSADIYRGPDGDYYQMTPAAREDPQVTALRGVALKSDPGKADIGTVMKRANAQIAPQALALMAQQAPIAGATTVTTPKPANDNKSSANDNAAAPASPAKDPQVQADTLAQSVTQYETDNPALTRAGQRLKAGALNLGASTSARLATVEEASRQRMAPYLDRIDKGEPLDRVLPTIVNGEVDPSLGLTPLDVDFIRRYYGTGAERAELRQQLSESIDGLVGTAAEYGARSEAMPRHPAVAAIAQAIHEKRYGDAVKIAATYPVGIAAQAGVESLPSLVPALAAGMVDPALGVAALTGADAAQSYGSAILGYLGQQGIDVTNPTAVREALSDPAVLEAAKRYAAAHAAASVATDLALGGLGKAAGGLLGATLKIGGKEASVTKGAAQGAALESEAASKTLQAGKEAAAAGTPKASAQESNPAATLGKTEMEAGDGVSNLGNAEKGLYLSTRPVADEFPELAGINPHYVEGARPGVNTNCASCVVATQERLTGKNVSAMANPSRGYAGRDALLPAFPFGPREDIASLAEAKKAMVEARDGAAGFLLIPQKNGVEHAINIINRGGKICLVDSQIGKLVTLPPETKVYFGVP